MNEELKTTPKKNKKAKKIIKIALSVLLIILCLAGLVYSVTGIVSHELTKKRYLETPSAQNGVFYPIDESADIMSEADYLAKNRYISYTNETGALTETITDGNYADFGEDIVFFADYFDKIISGDYEKFDELFTKSYFNTHDHTDTVLGFTPQRIYDIHVSYASEYSQLGKTYSVYEVTYKIMKNDGTFRNDIGSDEYRAQYITLLHGDDGIHISGIAYSYDPTFDYSLSAVKEEIIVGAIALAIAAAFIIIKAIVSARKKKRKDKVK